MLENTAIIEVNLHGINTEEAQKKIDAALRRSTDATYRIRCIHGYNRGTHIKQMIYREYGYGLSPKVKRIEAGSNEGITELVLREY